ncbi:MAG: serine hydrolase [Terrimicrobiaceae bacterium]|nr:beta-lactamase family protein [Terrimicrobiaceae bacterium]
MTIPGGAKAKKPESGEKRPFIGPILHPQEIPYDPQIHSTGLDIRSLCCRLVGCQESNGSIARFCADLEAACGQPCDRGRRCPGGGQAEDTNCQYSNAGFNTVGRIVEVVSGVPCEQFLDERIFQPLGMKDTTFWPNEEQVARLAKAYHPTPDKSGIVEQQIDQLTYPLNDRKRKPMPAGGLFSTAADFSRFAQMVLNQGIFEGKRCLSEEACRQLTINRAPGPGKQGYGFGFGTDGVVFGHAGAYKTEFSIHLDRGLVFVFMVQNNGWRNEDGLKIMPALTKAAMEAFGKQRDAGLAACGL